MSKSIIVIISIVILVIGISYGAYWYLTSPQVTVPVEGEKLITEEKAPVPTEQPKQLISWKTYQNKKYGYEVSYPADWRYILSFSGKLRLTHEALSDIAITPQRIPETIDEYAAENLKGHEIESRQEIQISDGRGLRIKSVANQRNYLSAYTKRGEFIYVFGSEIFNKNVYPEVEKVFDAVLASMKFELFQDVPEQFLLEEQSLKNINDWSTHRSEYAGYLIKYPKYWCMRESSVTSVHFTSYPCDFGEGRGGSPPKQEMKVSVSIPALGQDTTLDEWISKLDIFEKQEVLVDGERAIRGRIYIGFMRKEEMKPGDLERFPFSEFSGGVWIIKNSTGYSITYAPHDSELVNIFDQMLSTFKFIK